jgi:hypothetical protein
MKTQKMSFKNIKDVLSRDEMKVIMAGSGGTGSSNLQTCINCVNTAVNTTCNSFNVPGQYHSYSACVGNISRQCYAYFSPSPNGCY